MKRLILAAVAGLVAAGFGETTFWVDAEKGNDAGSGGKGAPFATLDRAKAAVRELKKSGKFPGDGVKVVVEGRFSMPLGGGFRLDKEDSGLGNAARVTWKAGPRGAKFDGAVKLTDADFGPVTDEAVRRRLREGVRDKVRVCDVKKFGVAGLKPFARQFIQWPGLEFFAYGRDMTVARYPNKGWIEIPKVVDRGVKPVDRKTGEWEHGVRGGTFTYEGADPERWDVKDGVYMKGFWCHDWSSETLRAAKIDKEKKEITTEGVHTYGIGNHAKWHTAKRRYYVYNLLDELDAPGEWFLDHGTGLLYFYPEDGKVGEAHLAVRKSPLFELDRVEWATVEGFDFKHTCGRAVSGARLKGVEFRGVTVSYVSTEGMVLWNCTDTLVEKCKLWQIGGMGLDISGGDRKTLTPGRNRVTGCEIHHCARLSRISGPCLRFWGCGNRIDHNYLHDTPYITVNYWGNENVFEYNEVECSMMESGDGGGVYTGRDWGSQGNIVRYNKFHHFGAEGVALRAKQGVTGEYEPLKENVMVMGLYLDDCDSGDIVYGNVFHKAGWAMFCGGGRDNKWRDNLCIGCTAAAQLDIRGLKRARPGEGTKDGWDLLKKLQDMDWQTGVWKERYPWLVDVMDNDPKLPIGTEYKGNVAIGCKQFFLMNDPTTKVAKEKLDFSGNAIVGGTTEREARRFAQTNATEAAMLRIEDNAALAALADRLGPAVQDTKEFRAAFPEFPRIPLEEIGVR